MKEAGKALINISRFVAMCLACFFIAFASCFSYDAAARIGATACTGYDATGCASHFDDGFENRTSIAYDKLSNVACIYDEATMPSANEKQIASEDSRSPFDTFSKLIAAETTVEINASKFDYLFGNVTSDAHNAARSIQNAAQLNRIEIQNTSEGTQILTENLTSAAEGDANIMSEFSKTLPDGSVINLQTRGSLLSGPGGFLKLESTWQVMPDGTMRFLTAIPKEGL